MTDNELDEMLNQWSPPPVPPSLRAHVRAAFAPGPKRKISWTRSLVAAAILAGAAFFLIVTQASPQVPKAPVPWTVDSEFIRYSGDGSSSIQMFSTSYEFDSNEVLLSRSMPGNPLKTAIGQALDVTLPALNRFHMRLLSTVVPGMAERFEQAKRSRRRSVGFITGCDSQCLTLDHYFYLKAGVGTSCTDRPIMGHATILNHSTEAVRDRWTENGRMTLWMAPDLACFALKVTYEAQRPDGTFHLVSAKQALKVNVNP